MRHFVTILLLLFGVQVFAQAIIRGKVVSRQDNEALPYAEIQVNGNRQILTNIDGSFKFEIIGDSASVEVSYIGFKTFRTTVYSAVKFVQYSLQPSQEMLQEVMIGNKSNPAEDLIQRAIEAKDRNDPEKVLENFQFRSYTKFIIDNENSQISLATDSTSRDIRTIINEGRGYLSEKVSAHRYSQHGGEQEEVIGTKTAGFERPVYQLLNLNINPFSLYQNSYNLYKTDYAGPLANDALRNYTYKILDTTQTKRPAYMIYFKPRREKVVAGLEGILYLDTETLAIQKAKAQLLGAIRLEVVHNYQYFQQENIWFPSSQTTTIRPGSGGKEIAVFGGTISVGMIQPKKSVLDIFSKQKSVTNDIYLNSSTTNYDIQFNSEEITQTHGAEILVNAEASDQPENFWESNRQEEFSRRDAGTQRKVDSLLAANGVKRKIEIKNAIASGYYPLGFWDLDLSKIFKFNNYEGIRLGLGGKTNDQVSDKFNIKGYTTYGFKDQVLKYGIGTEIYLNKRTNSSLNFFHSRDIEETGTFDYLKGSNTFAILEPRFVNINFFYNYRNTWASVTHDIIPQLSTELRLGRQEIWQIKNYAFQENGQAWSDYELGMATFSFIWRPFSKFLSTPESTKMIERNFPQLTGQIEHSFKGLFNGDFDFTRLGLKAEHEIKNLDRSRTEFILEGNLAFGEVPLTHVFHSYPNNPNREQIFRRFSVAGRNSFETMYYNEFFSDRQAMLHVRHQLRPFLITEKFQPQLVLISRFAIGNMDNPEEHLNIPFKTMEKGFSEAGLELNRIFSGFGISTAYRYGAYHLPTFKENFSLKFTLQLEL
ncbi:MAG: DUF5686 family protein [Christiangramia sp.]|nr:carboxypeptidase [Christiangramia sp.]